MKNQAIHHEDIRTMLAPALGQGASPVHWAIRAMRGGLDSLGVLKVTARFHSPGEKCRTQHFVIKRLATGNAREARIYQEILAQQHSSLAPILFAVRHLPIESRLCLESLQPAEKWPWADFAWARRVLEALAGLHTHPSNVEARWSWLGDWDYEAELASRSQQLVRLTETLDRKTDIPSLRRSLPALRRLTAALPHLRQELFRFRPFERTLIHGDVHTGNVLIRKSPAGLTPAFLDWGRSRFGSPLEDIASWLQSLAYWEPEVRRRHDTLLGSYLAARGMPQKISSDLRDGYWLAAASNVFAGALLFHLSVAMDHSARISKRRQASLLAIQDCLRIIRRADACWTSPARTTPPAWKPTL